MGTAGQSITLANSIIGVGILAMPFCFQQCGVLLATLILLSMGLVSRLCCYFLLKSALLARRRNFEFLAFHVFGPAGKLAVEVGIIGFLMGTCIAYFVVVGDLGPQIIAKMLNINQSDILRTSIMVIVSLVCVLPLGLLRNVDSLSNVSAATICFYFCLVMKVIAEAASQLFTNDWSTRVEMWKPSGLLQCVPIFSMALFCQTQLFEIFESLPTLSLEKMNLVTKNAINICTGVYFTLGLFGYLAFSSHEISGNVLISLSPTMASDVIKLGFVMSVAFSFPLIIFPCRASIYSLLYKKVHSSHHDHIINHSIPETTFRCITVAIIGVSLFTSLLIPNIELVLGLVGSTIGVLICVVFPAACFVNVTFKDTNERILAKAAVVLGLIIMVLGTYANLQAAESKLDRYDDRFITQERIDKIVEDFFEKREKLDDGKIEPLLKEDAIPLDALKIDNNIIKDSEMQPPNPVPPDTSNEKNDKVVNKREKNVDILPEVKEQIAKISELHPKDVKTKLTETKPISSNERKLEDKAKAAQDPKASSVEDKLHIIKQQKLIETIKQHGEEQKELIKEQKEILDEIIKTKNELQENKNEVDSKEAKKIAVESIKQIANMAIQSIGGGVSEKPNKEIKNDKVAQNLEKLTNEAVKEIAKKAVETIEAIQEIKENPDIPIVKTENLVHNSGKNSLSNLNQINNEQNFKQKLIDPQEKPSNNIVVPDTKDTIPKVPTNPKNAQNADILNKIPIQNPANLNIDNTNVEQSKVETKIDTDKVHSEKIDNKQVPMVNGVDNIIPKALDQFETRNEQVLKQSDVKHLHSQDEPQSYKLGEDSQKLHEIIPNNVPKLPIPLASNKAEVKKEVVNDKVLMKPKEAIVSKLANLNNGDVPKNDVINDKRESDINNIARQKREVLDCSDKSSLRIDEKEICEKLLELPQKENDFLPKVDLNEVLSKHLPADPNMLHHVGRSLKSFDEMDKDR